MRSQVEEVLSRHTDHDVATLRADMDRDKVFTAREAVAYGMADAARISMPYLSELERGRKEASSEVLAAAARALGLGLTDLLSLAQDELTRPAQVRPARRGTPPSPRHDGMCLAA
ncbi:helix-turn-helix domain-containing protein [Streptomyces sp. me109]|uniref:ATP-dependent Clp protease proteolytic subunit n=1 Tax=Streptomyces sp. me109 TaxID=1827853 RepID=UPI0011CE3713|nr:helix-turn-helix domain-containing protein [Streptomyces sp. me109]